jgi:hypothetical protein
MQRNHDLVALEQYGITLPGAMEFIDPTWKGNFQAAMDGAKVKYGMALDAQPALITSPNSAIPVFLTTFVDPDLIKVLLAKNKAAEIIGEVKKGSFVDTTAMFPMVEYTGEVSSYGDHSNNGRVGANLNFPQRQQYIYQTIVEYGDLEMERAGLAKVGWASEMRNSAVVTLNKFQNLTYFYGVAGLQNYGLINDPNLPASLTPTVKAAGNGNVWWYNGAPNATANEVFADIQSMYRALVSQAQGLVEADTPMTLALSPSSATALTFTNSFNVNVNDLLKKNFPNLKVETAVQYGAVSASNPQGNAGGEFVQLIAANVEGQETGYAAFSEKLRAGPVIREMSAFKQKLSQGTWGAVIRQPFAISSMLGV